MPYIVQSRRSQLNGCIDGVEPQSPGELNYVISKLVWQWWKKHPSYTTGNEVMGVLSAAGHEFYRRVLAPYENAKISENGDVFE